MLRCAVCNRGRPRVIAVTAHTQRLTGREWLGVVLAGSWLATDWMAGLNLGTLGVVATYVLAPAGMVMGASGLARWRSGARANLRVALVTLVMGAVGTAFALWLLATR